MESAEAENQLGIACEKRGRADLACRAYERAVGLDGREPTYFSNLLLALHYLPGASAGLLRDAHLDWGKRHAAPLAPADLTGRFAGRDRSPGRRLRVGYVSADLRRHPSAAFLEPFLAAHDQDQVELYGYSDAPKPDRTTDRIRRAFAVWRETPKLNDDALAALITADGVDVLVESAGHGPQNRLLTFARRPAPVQVVYPNYPDTTGIMGVFDAIALDDDRAPAGAESRYAEPVARLRVSSQCYRPPDDEGPDVASDPPCARNGFVTFACLNRLVKVTPEVARLWGRVLAAVPMSRMAVLVDWRPGDDAAGDDARARLAATGVPVDRLDFVPRMTRPAYLAFYNRVDVALDTFPYNGHTTTLDATWMGVPTVTLAGQTHASREGLAILKHVGLDHLIATTPADYVRAAVALAGRRGELAALRRELRGRLTASPLCDGRRVAAALEDLYRNLWRRWCARTKTSGVIPRML